MALFLYNIFLALYSFGIRVYALFNGKAAKWVAGRKDWERKLQTALKPGEKRIWIHCSSLGEFEQGRPLIEALKKKYPGYKIVLTFFSPSGYEACGNYRQTDYIFYLPMDGKANARAFIAAIQPSLAIFVKYEFWYYYLYQLHEQKIPTIIVSAAFRKEQVFFKWYGDFFRRMLSYFDFIFVQDEASKMLLQQMGVTEHVFISGDTRYDRVAAIAENIKPIAKAEAFKQNNKILIAGSTWPGDEEILKDCIDILPADWKLIIAPHEVDVAHTEQVQQLFPGISVRFSQLSETNTGADKKVLIIDNIGMLSSLYDYGTIGYVGGGFQKGGIHNVLEPAIFGLPVIFGPVYEKFVEAVALARQEYAFPVANAAACKEILNKLIADKEFYIHIHHAVKAFMQQQIGATGIILDHIDERHWLAG